MTDRLYYNDTYLTEFDAHVLECRAAENGYAVRLDRSAFYPTSGGQPFDTGILGGANICDVYVDGTGEVWHITDAPLAEGACVHGSIDWKRRFDHMQQHAGEHMLANAAYRLLGGNTIGLHLGSDISTIDMTLPEGRTRITAEELRALEDDVNSRIQRDVPIKQWFPESAELAVLPLRKPPTVNEHVRIVQIGELEYCACGGTHPYSAGQIGLVKIVDARPSRGKLRLAFVCGKRAFELFRSSYNVLHETADMLSTSASDVPGIVRSLSDEVRALTRELNQVRKEMLIASADVMLEGATVNSAGVRVVAEIVKGDSAAARELATHLCTTDSVIAIIGTDSGAGIAYVVCKAANVDCNCGAVLSASAKQVGGKGGGRADFAQGGGPADMLDIIKANCLSAAALSVSC